MVLNEVGVFNTFKSHWKVVKNVGKLSEQLQICLPAFRRLWKFVGSCQDIFGNSSHEETKILHI